MNAPIIIGVILAVILIIFLAMAAMRPSDFRISRSASIPASPTALFAQVDTLRNWEAWSPWLEADPNATTTYAGPPAGPGASFAWAGNNKVGAGRTTLIESRPNELVRFRLDFLRPFKATNQAEFTFKPEGNRTTVTWTMTGNYNFISKAVGLIINCDKMVGGQFEKGLAKMQKMVESAKK